MKINTFSMLAGSSLFLLASVAVAQTSTTATKAGAEVSGLELEEIVVTARRKEESLQDVPTVVNVVTADSLAKFNIQKFEDVQALVPGLQLSGDNKGFGTSASIRGASFQPQSGASPTVEFYLNDANIDSIQLFQSMFDVGQVEVLRGPQGTLRGRSSPSGSITVSTTKAKLSEFGGYATATGTSMGGRSVNGALNLPIINDMLALRVAGIMENTRYDDVHTTAPGGFDPSQKTRGGRISVRFDPNDAISANFMYQYLTRDLVSYDPVESISLIDSTQPAVSPVISAGDRLGITDGAATNNQRTNIVNGSIDYRFAGQKLTYVGSYVTFDLQAASPNDAANKFPSQEWFNYTHSQAKNQTQELRLSSEERLFDLFDYTVGAFYRVASTPSYLNQQQAVLLPTAQGGAITAINDSPVVRSGNAIETSEFVSLTWHIDYKTELTGGFRHIDNKKKGTLDTNGVRLAAATENVEEKPNVYNFSLKHNFTDDFMTYVNVGSAWRLGPYFVGVFRQPTPNLNLFTHLDSEKSTSYEIGSKATFFEKRLRVNAAVYHQDYDNYIYRGPRVWYINQSRTGLVPATFNFGSSVKAKVDGVELDSDFQISKHWNAGASFSYAKGEIKNGLVACTDLNGDGVPDTNGVTPTLAQLQASVPAGEAVASCRVNIPLSTSPKWSATIQSEYSMPVTSNMDAYLRGLLSYHPNNDQDTFNPYGHVDSYGLLNLFTGLRNAEGNWEVSVFAKNLTNTKRVLTTNSNPQATSANQQTVPPATTGVTYTSSYINILSQTPQREFGVNVRYAFGSR